MTHRKGKAGVFVKGGKPGPGRPKGSKDSIPRMTRKEMSEFFLSCTVDNLKWRQNFKRKLEMALDPTEYHNLTKTALLYGIGLPVKEVPQVVQRDPVLFIGIPPWADEKYPMRAKTAAMNLANDAEILLALEAAKPAGEVIIDAADERDEAHGFEAVKPSPADPSAPRDLEPPIYPPPRERDRPPRDSNR
jgi:hypothetical protein